MQIIPSFHQNLLQCNSDPSLYLLANPTALPADSQPVSLQGKLLGRRGISTGWDKIWIMHLPLVCLMKLHQVLLAGSLL